MRSDSTIAQQPRSRAAILGQQSFARLSITIEPDSNTRGAVIVGHCSLRVAVFACAEKCGRWIRKPLPPMRLLSRLFWLTWGACMKRRRFSAASCVFIAGNLAGDIMKQRPSWRISAHCTRSEAISKLPNERFAKRSLTSSKHSGEIILAFAACEIILRLFARAPARLRDSRILWPASRALKVERSTAAEAKRDSTLRAAKIEDYGDVGFDLDGHSVQTCWAIAPLADSV